MIFYRGVQGGNVVKFFHYSTKYVAMLTLQIRNSGNVGVKSCLGQGFSCSLSAPVLEKHYFCTLAIPNHFVLNSTKC